MALDEGVVGIKIEGTDSLYICRAENRRASQNGSSNDLLQRV
jgi:hypothetical protein